MEKTENEGPSLPSVTEGVFIGPGVNERDWYESMKIAP